MSHHNQRDLDIMQLESQLRTQALYQEWLAQFLGNRMPQQNPAEPIQDLEPELDQSPEISEGSIHAI